MTNQTTYTLSPHEPLAVSPTEAARLSGLGRTTIFAAIKSGELRSTKIGTRRLITIEAIKAWLENNEVPSKREG